MEEKNRTFLRWDEATEILRSVNDPITGQLMNMANFEVLRKAVQLKEFPIASFDMGFFMDVMKSFCSDHETLRKILSGEDLRLFDDAT